MLIRKGVRFLIMPRWTLPDGRRIGGIGTYHMEYDYANTPPYKWLREALHLGNVVYPGKLD